MSWHLTLTLRILRRFQQVLVRPLEVLAVLHAVPLIGRVSFGDEVGDAGGDSGVTAADFFADRRDRLGQVDDAVQVDRPFARQAAHEVQLDCSRIRFETRRGSLRSSRCS